MSAVLVQVADAIVDLLNATTTLSQKFTAERRYPNIKEPLTKLGTLRVDVTPTSHPRSELGTRASTEYDCRCIITIRKRFSQSARNDEGLDGRPVGNEAIDELILLVEEIHDYLSSPDRRRLSNAQQLDAAWESTLIQNTYVDQHLQDYDQYTGVIRVNYVACKDQ